MDGEVRCCVASAILASSFPLDGGVWRVPCQPGVETSDNCLNVTKRCGPLLSPAFAPNSKPCPLSTFPCQTLQTRGLLTSCCTPHDALQIALSYEQPSPLSEGTPQPQLFPGSASQLLGGSHSGSLRAVPRNTQSPTLRLDKSKARALQSRIDPLRLDVDAFQEM